MTNSISAININYVESLIKKEAEESEDQRIASVHTLINKFAKELKLNITAGSLESSDNDEASTVDASANTQKDEEYKTAYYNNPTVKLAQSSIKGYLSDSKFATKYNNFVATYGRTASGEVNLDVTKNAAQTFISQTLSDSKFATRYNSFVSKYTGTGTVEVPQTTQQSSDVKQSVTQYINDASALVSKSKYGQLYTSMSNDIQITSANENVAMDTISNYNMANLITKSKIDK